ncbi:MAG: hypothetical protein ACI9M9_002464 [Flavobacteriaceae bacterium]|jgi:hypothetical protein
MSLKNTLFVTLSLVFFQELYAQRNFDDYNRIGITGGITLFDISTSDLTTEQGQGFEGGFTTRGAFRGPFDLIYGISFFNNSIGVKGSVGANGAGDTQFIDYQIQAVQIGLLGSLNIIKHHLSIEFGPIININGKMKLDTDRYKDYILDGYSTLRAQDIQDINRINFLFAGGLTVGFRSFRVGAMYQYGLTNMLDKLNDKEFEKKSFKGKSATLIFSGTLYF